MLIAPGRAGNVVGVDPHRRILIATVADARGGIVGLAHFRVSGGGRRELGAWARQFGQVAGWGVEGSASWGRHTAWPAAAMTFAMCARTVCRGLTCRAGAAGLTRSTASGSPARRWRTRCCPRAFKRVGQERGPDEQHRLLALWIDRRRSILSGRQQLVGEAECLLCELPPGGGRHTSCVSLLS